MSSQTTTSPVFKLGKIVFTVENCSKNLQDQLAQMLPRASFDDPQEPIVLVNESGDDLTAMRPLINSIFKLHHSCFWADAACLISPSGKKVMLTGKSSAGKSTTSIALALGHKWKVLSEDITLVDSGTGEILSFATPFSLKQGTLDLLEDGADVVPETIIQHEWVPIGVSVRDEIYKVPFDIAVHLEITDQERSDFSWSPLSPTEYVRRVLPVSNLLRITDGTEVFLDYVKEGGCFSCVNGSVSERITKLRELVA